MISIQQMHYILVLSEERHFQRASDRCYVTQPTLSMQIKKAEDTLGQPIFDRSKSPLELTVFGRSLLPIIRETLSDHEKISELVSKSKGTYVEELRIGIIPTVANYLLPDLFKEWQNTLEDIQLIIEELKTEEILLAFEQKKLDVGIIAGPLVDPRLRIVPLFKEEILVYYPEGKKKSITIDELQDAHPWLLTSGNCLRTQMMNFCEIKEKKDRSWDYEGGNIDLLERMVRQNGGYTLVPEYYIAKKGNDYKRIESSTGEIPIREIIALSSNKTTKWDSVERMIRSIQLQYNAGGEHKKNYQVLNWK